MWHSIFTKIWPTALPGSGCTMRTFGTRFSRSLSIDIWKCYTHYLWSEPDCVWLILRKMFAVLHCLRELYKRLCMGYHLPVGAATIVHRTCVELFTFNTERKWKSKKLWACANRGVIIGYTGWHINLISLSNWLFATTFCMWHAPHMVCDCSIFEGLESV